jgi:NADH-quinone oxidoreductase subunit E
MLRRLYPEQPDNFAFTPANREWAEMQIAKYPEGRQASAIIPLLWRAQEQEGWLTRPAIEHVADMLGLAHIRALEVATFYFMFQLQPVGSVAHVQVCGTTSCMICGAEDLISVCRERIAPEPHALSADGKFSWEEVECLGACANAPMVQIGKDYYEDLTAERLGEILDALARGEVPRPGPQNDRFSSEPIGGETTLGAEDARSDANASVALALEIGDTIKRIDGTEIPLRAPWYKADEDVPRVRDAMLQPSGMPDPEPTPGPRPAEGKPADATGVTEQEPKEEEAGRPATNEPADAASGESPSEAATGHDPATAGDQPIADDLTEISGIGPKIAEMLNEAGIHRFAQIAAWTDEDIDRFDAMVGGPEDRVRRDDWVEQARRLTEGTETDG